MFAERLANWLSKPVAKEGINQPDNLDVVLRTDIGLKRKENQDRVVAMRVNTPFSTGRPFFVIALADGMGGMTDGAQCASLTLSTFLYSLIRYRSYPPEERLKQSALDANQAVYGFAKGKGGSTLSAILIEVGSPPCTVNIGDSRIYSFKRNVKNSVVRLSVDDSLEEVFGGDDRSLLQFSGMGEGIKPHTQYLGKDGEIYCLTSDGIHFIDESVFDDIIFHSDELKQAAFRLGEYVKWCGAHDNASLALVNCSDIESSLEKHHDIGVEVWDAFSQLHILWMKNDPNSAGYFEQNTLDRDGHNKGIPKYEDVKREHANNSRINELGNVSSELKEEKNIYPGAVENNSVKPESGAQDRVKINVDESKLKERKNTNVQPELFDGEIHQTSEINAINDSKSSSVYKRSYQKKFKKNSKRDEEKEEQASIKIEGEKNDE